MAAHSSAAKIEKLSEADAAAEHWISALGGTKGLVEVVDLNHACPSTSLNFSKCTVSHPHEVAR